jgi:hypothetical protein
MRDNPPKSWISRPWAPVLLAVVLAVGDDWPLVLHLGSETVQVESYDPLYLTWQVTAVETGGAAMTWGRPLAGLPVDWCGRFARPYEPVPTVKLWVLPSTFAGDKMSTVWPAAKATLAPVVWPEKFPTAIVQVSVVLAGVQVCEPEAPATVPSRTVNV